MILLVEEGLVLRFGQSTSHGYALRRGNCVKSLKVFLLQQRQFFLQTL